MSEGVVGEFTIPANHPALPGHFPGRPVVPGVVLLDEVYAAARAHEPRVLRAIQTAKFLQPVFPGERIEVRLRFAAAALPELRVDFQGLRAGSVVFEGALVLGDEAP